ncbi:MAG: helix-turn-helix domain-containing protein [Bacteroidales bacterium]|nr:helix-turn-helix domain-containing protein [Bacteroidales bacterium]
MIHNPVFIFPSENPKHKKHEPKLEGVVKTDYSEDVDTLSSMNRKIIELEGRIEDSNGRNEMLDANGAAKLTGYSVNTIRQKTSDRTIPFHKLPNGSAVRYSKTELLEWMESGNGKKRESLFDNIANGIRQKHK